MAINPSLSFPTKTSAPTPEYPYGSARDITTPGDGTGTPWRAEIVNDIFGFQQALLDAAGIVPSTQSDKVGASQYLESARIALGAVAKSIAELQALTPSAVGQKAFLSSGGRSGEFIWDASDRSSDVSVDTLQGVYIAPDSDLTGESGAWVRNYEMLLCDFFGAINERSVDSTVAVQACVNLAEYLSVIPRYGNGSYYHDTITLPWSQRGFLGQGVGSTRVYGFAGKDLYTYEKTENTIESLISYFNPVYGQATFFLDETIDNRNGIYRDRVGPDGENIGNCFISMDIEHVYHRRPIYPEYRDYRVEVYQYNNNPKIECGTCFTNFIGFGHKTSGISQVHRLEYGTISGINMARKISSQSGASFTVKDFYTIEKLEPQPGTGYAIVKSDDPLEVGDKICLLFEQDKFMDGNGDFTESTSPRKAYYIRSISQSGNDATITIEDSGGNLVTPDNDLTATTVVTGGNKPVTMGGCWMAPAEEYGLENSLDSGKHKIDYTSILKCPLSFVNGTSWNINGASFFYQRKGPRVYSDIFGGPVIKRKAIDWFGACYAEGPFDSTANDITYIHLEIDGVDISGLGSGKTSNTLRNVFIKGSAVKLNSNSLGGRWVINGDGHIDFGEGGPSVVLKDISGGFDLRRTKHGNPGVASKDRQEVLSTSPLEHKYSSSVPKGLHDQFFVLTSKNSRLFGNPDVEFIDDVDSNSGVIASGTVATTFPFSMSYYGVNDILNFGTHLPIGGYYSITARIKSRSGTVNAKIRLLCDPDDGSSNISFDSDYVSVDSDWTLVRAVLRSDTFVEGRFQVGIICDSASLLDMDYIAVVPPQRSITAESVRSEDFVMRGTDNNEYKLTRPTGAGSASWELL